MTVDRPGFEPGTSSLQRTCATNCATGPIAKTGIHPLIANQKADTATGPKRPKYPYYRCETARGWGRWPRFGAANVPITYPGTNGTKRQRRSHRRVL